MAGRQAAWHALSERFLGRILHLSGSLEVRSEAVARVNDSATYLLLAVLQAGTRVRGAADVRIELVELLLLLAANMVLEVVE